MCPQYSIMRMYTKHRADILNYERQYRPTSSIYSETKPAKDYLISNFSDGNNINGQVIVGSGISTYSYQEGTSGIDAPLQGTSYNDLMFGEKGADLILGGAGNDVIYGGEGGDTIDGGAGNDILKDESGNDSYIFTSSSGQDTIIDSDGVGAVILSGRQLAGGKGKDGLYKDSAGNTYQWSGTNGSNLVINGSITVENFYNGKLGIWRAA